MPVMEMVLAKIPDGTFGRYSTAPEGLSARTGLDFLPSPAYAEYAIRTG
jgi:hypothetical protein